MPWSEFCALLGGISYETPLGKIVSIRSEEDKERIKTFTQEQHRIRNEFRSRRVKEIVQKDPETARAMTREFQAAMKAAFSKK